jgi:hypothetical protein
MERDNVKYFKVDGRFVRALHDYIVARPFKEVANLVGGFGEITEIFEDTAEVSRPLAAVPDEGTAHC